MERDYGNTCTGCGKIKQGEISRSREERFGKRSLRYTTCTVFVLLEYLPLIVFAIISSRPFDLLQHPKELARQITLIDHGMTFDHIHVFDYI